VIDIFAVGVLKSNEVRFGELKLKWIDDESRSDEEKKRSEEKEGDAGFRLWFHRGKNCDEKKEEYEKKNKIPGT